MNKIWDKENTQLYLLFFACFISVYYLPVVITRVFFAVFILYVFATKKDYFWLVLFFILNDAPGRLFAAGGRDEIMRLPIYTFGVGFSMGFEELFALAYLAKVILLRKRLDFVFFKQFKWFFFSAAGVIVYSGMLGMDLNSLVATFRSMLPWSWVIIFPFFIRDKATLIKVCRLLFPIVFLALASQIYTYFTGTYLNSSFTKDIVLVEDIAQGGEAIRSGSSAFILFFCILMGMFFLLADTPSFKRTYLIFLVFTGSLSILLTATRGWIIALVVLYLGIFLFISYRIFSRKLIQAVVLSFLLLIVLQFIFPVIGKQIDNSLSRLSTMGDLAKGDLTAGGTLGRMTERGPLVMNQFWRSPFFGWGFTATFFEHADGHVGNQSILLNVGILGYSILLLIYLAIFFEIWRWSTRPAVVAYYGISLRVFAIGMFGVFIIHSSSTQFWGYYMEIFHLTKCLFYAIFLSSVNALIINTKSHVKSVKQIQQI